MNIPSKFTLISRRYKVVDDREIDLDGKWGLCIPGRAIIKLAPEGSGFSEEARGQTFCHELVHAILFAMNKRELFEDEEFVDLFGSLLHQFLETAR